MTTKEFKEIKKICPQIIGHMNLEDKRTPKEIREANSRRNAWLSS
jgi:hypothetical protein